MSARPLSILDDIARANRMSEEDRRKNTVFGWWVFAGLILMTLVIWGGTIAVIVTLSFSEYILPLL